MDKSGISRGGGTFGAFCSIEVLDQVVGMNAIPTWLLAVGAVLGLGVAFMPWQTIDKNKPLLVKAIDKLSDWLGAISPFLFLFVMGIGVPVIGVPFIMDSAASTIPFWDMFLRLMGSLMVAAGIMAFLLAPRKDNYFLFSALIVTGVSLATAFGERSE